MSIWSKDQTILTTTFKNIGQHFSKMRSVKYEFWLFAVICRVIWAFFLSYLFYFILKLQISHTYFYKTIVICLKLYLLYYIICVPLITGDSINKQILISNWGFICISLLNGIIAHCTSISRASIQRVHSARSVPL